LWEETLDILVSRYGEEHMYVAAVLESMGAIDLERERYDDAVPRYERALEIRREVLGDEHPHVALSHNNMGYLFFRKGDDDVARSHYEQALMLRRRIYGDDHPAVAVVLSNLGQLHESRDDFEGAREAYAAALAIRRARLGDADPRTLRMWNGVARAHARLGEEAKASAAYDELLAAARGAADAEGGSVTALMQTAQLLLQCEVDSLRDPQQALRYARRADALSGHSNADCLALVAQAAFAAGDATAAVEAMQNALAHLPNESSTRSEYEQRLRDYEAAAAGAAP
jgi:tetratricopeptide (TPR) repeat protein